MSWIQIESLPWWAKTLDVLMIPFMYIAQGNVHESPQRTHAWNNIKLSQEQVESLNQGMMVYSVGDRSAGDLGGVRRHLPWFGGWTSYIVVRPNNNPDVLWHVGWVEQKNGGVAGLSLVPIPKGEGVKVLLGPGRVYFFALNSGGIQILLDQVGSGQIGDGRNGQVEMR